MRQADLILENITLIDGSGRGAQQRVSVVIDQGKIASIETGSVASDDPNIRIVDGRGKFLIPGLWDTHIHIGGTTGGLAHLVDFASAEFAQNWRAYLYNGVTSVLDVAGPLDVLLEARDAERRGELVGPRIFAVGPAFTAPGGHPVGTIFVGNDHWVQQAARETQDARHARAEVRRLLLEDRVDAIKAIYDAGRGTFPRLDPKVLRAIVDETHEHGRRVFVHAESAPEATEALESGADGIEHMIGAEEAGTKQALHRAAETGVYWTPTLSVFEAFARSGDTTYLEAYPTAGSVSKTLLESLSAPNSRWKTPSPEIKASLERRIDQTMAAAELAREFGVKIALGTDAGNPATFHGISVHRELSLMVEAGFSPMEAICAATSVAAEKLGAQKRLGTIAVGKEADVVLLAADPLQHIDNTRQIELIVKRGIPFSREELQIE